MRTLALVASLLAATSSAAAQPVATPPTTTPPTTTPPPAPTRLQQAEDALRRGDTRAVVAVLEGHIASARELAMVIEAYRSLGDTPSACRNLDLYLERYSPSPGAAGYRQRYPGICGRPAPPGPTSNMPPDLALIERAQAAELRGDHAGAIRVLEGHTTSARTLALLIELYRETRNARAVCTNMRLYLTQYPGGENVRLYRPHVARRCRR